MSDTPDTTTTPDQPQQAAAGDAAQPTVPTGDPKSLVVMQDPGTSMTSTGDSIVDNDISDEDFEAEHNWLHHCRWRL